MRYLGGKASIGKKIAEHLEAVRPPGAPYLEPFVGGCNVLPHMSGVRVASDLCEPLVALYNALQDGWIPPAVVTEDDYKKVSAVRDPKDPMTAFVGFGCSYGGKYFGGYARDADGKNYASVSARSLLKKLVAVDDVCFWHGSYSDYSPSGCLVYCDPPYANTTEYGAARSFDHDTFWNTVREWSTRNVVRVSEYAAPTDFECVMVFHKRLSVNKYGNGSVREDRLFRLRGAP